MEQIKLQIGKTYLNRKGEEVEIIRKVGDRVFPYRGNDGSHYTESGRFRSQGGSSNDLIEEAPKFSRTFDIPEGVKKVTVSHKGNRVIVEMVPEKVEPKPGDVMIDSKGNVYIFKSVVGDIHKHFAGFWKDGRLVIGTWCNPGRPATPEEAQPIFDALKKAGKRWNAETMEVEEIPEKEKIMDYLQCHYTNNAEWNYKQLCWIIEDYLKYREGKEKEKDRPNP